MPKCVLRVTGSSRKVRQFLLDSPLIPLTVYYKGDPGRPLSRGPVTISGFNIALSGSHGESIEKQERQALVFLKKHSVEIGRLKAFNFRSIQIDFGLYDQSGDNRPWPTYHLSKQLVETVGNFGFSITLSFYGS